MKKTRCFSLILVLCALACLSQAQEPSLWQLQGTTDNSEIKSYENTGVILAKHGVIMTNATTVLTADQAMANQVNGEVTAEGDVTILSNGKVWRGTNAIYNFKTGEISSGAFRTTHAPFFIAGHDLAGSTNRVYTGTNTVITSDDVVQPLYHIRAKTITISPGQYFEARAATVYIGKVPIFYFPYYRRYLGRHPNNFEFTPGYRSLFGPYLLTSYNWTLNTNLDGALHFDWREKRGWAGGPDFHYGFGHVADGEVKYYFAHDKDPVADATAIIPRQDRSRFYLTNVSELTSNLTVKIVARYQSDPLIIHDFFEREYRQNVQPSSYAEATQTWPNFTLDAMAQVRLINFYETVERLPDIKLTGERQQVFATPIFYESESDLGFFRRRFVGSPTGAITNLINSGGIFDPVVVTPGQYNRPYEATRGDTFHQFTLPKTFFNWLNVTPRVGGRVTYYSSVSGVGITNMNEQTRGVFNTGAEVSFKASRFWPEAESKFWEVDGLRHIIEPDFNYVFVPSPTRSPAQLPQFDYESPSFRLSPIDFPDYNSIDSIDSQNVIRLALRNKLQTKREGTIQDLVNWALYTDWRLDPRTNQNFITSTATNSWVGKRQSRFGDLFSDLDIRPRSWLTVNSQLRYSVELDRIVDSYQSIVIQPNDVWSMALSYRYLMNNDPEFFTTLMQTNTGNKLLSASLYYRLNENWGAHVAERFEANTGKLEEQIYTVYRDMRSWTSALNFRVRQNSVGPTDFSVILSFSLKSFPRYKMGQDSDHAPRLLGDY